MDNLKISTLISEKEIQQRVAEIGEELTNKFKDQNPIAICVLKGSILFYADLVRAIKSDLICEFIGLSSYGSTSKSSGEVKLTNDINHAIEGRDVIVIEDIVDTGLTMNYLHNILKARNPKSITTVSLLLKPDALKTKCDVDYVGFEIPNDFVVGYGLDYNGKHRNLPYIGQVASLN